MPLPSTFVKSQEVLRDVLPSSVTPFTWSVFGAAAERLARSFYSDLGYQIPADLAIWQLGDGRPTLNGAVLAQAEQAVFGSTTAPSSSLGQRLFGGGMDRRVGAVVRQVLDEAPLRFAAVQRWHDRVQTMQWRQATVLQIMEEIEPQAEAALAGQTALLALASIMRQMAAWLAEWLPATTGDLLPRLFAGADAAPASAVYRQALTQLAQAAQQDQAAVAFLQQGDWQADLPAGGFRQAFEQFIAHFGRWAEIPLEAASPRWREAPDRLLAAIAAHLTQPAVPALLSLDDAAQQRAAAAFEIGKQLGMLRRRHFQPAFDDMQQLVALAVAGHHAAVTVVDTARTWALGAAQEVVADGRLAAVEDVFLLELEELKQIMTGEWSSPDQVRSLIAARQPR